MSPIPHYIDDHHKVIAVDFDRGWLLVGELARKRGDVGSTVVKHHRLRYVDGVWHKDSPARGCITCPRLDAESYVWQPNRGEHARVAVEPERHYVLVDSSTLARALGKLSKLANKSLGIDGLLTLRAHAHGLSLVSHSEASATYNVDGKAVAREGLGTVVVLGEALRQLVKNSNTSTLAIEVAPRTAGRTVSIGGVPLWTVDAEPKHDTTGDVSYSPLSTALVRALPFVSNDDARPNINRVQITGHGDHVLVTATDDHCLYRERVEMPDFGFGSYYIPRRVLDVLHNKRASYLLGFNDEGVVTVSVEGLAVACPSDGATFPPSEQVITPLKRLAEFTGRDLPAATVNAIRTWLHSPALRSVDDVAMQVASDPAGVRFFVGDDVHDFCVAGTTFEPAPENERSKTPWNVRRLFVRQYLADAFAAIDPDTAVRIAVDGELEPLYLTDGSRTVVVMPKRF